MGDTGRGANRLPGKLNVKTEPPLERIQYFGCSIVLVFSGLLFFAFFGLFFGDFSFQYAHLHPDLPSFLKFF